MLAQLLERPPGTGRDAGEQFVLGDVARVDVVGQHLDVEALAQVVEDLPRVAVLGRGRHDRRRVARADLGQELVEEVRDVGALERIGAAEGVRGELGRLGVHDVEHGEHVERGEPRRPPVRGRGTS